MGRRTLLGAAIAALLVLGLAAPAGASLQIHVLSDRANLISGGEALTAVTLPRTVKPGTVTMTLNGSDVTSQFALRANGSYEGLLTGLQLGSNTLTAQAPGQTTAQTAIVDHAIGGPVLSGPQIKPW